MTYNTYHDLLTEEFELRKSSNPRYSLRAFSRHLGIAAPSLSLVLNKKRGLSNKMAQSLADKLKLDDDKRQWFCNSVGALHSRSNKDKIHCDAIIEKSKLYSKCFQEIQLEFFNIISEWYHFAILELTYLKDFVNDSSWIAAKLGITNDQASIAIKRLKDLNLLQERDGKLIDTFQFLSTPSDVASATLKQFNSQLLNKALVALHTQSVEQREIASSIIAVNKEQVSEIKEKIRFFRKKIIQDISKDSGKENVKPKDAVYCLNTNFFELTMKEIGN